MLAATKNEICSSLQKREGALEVKDRRFARCHLPQSSQRLDLGFYLPQVRMIWVPWRHGQSRQEIVGLRVKKRRRGGGQQFLVMTIGQNPAAFTSNRTLAKGWGEGRLLSTCISDLANTNRCSWSTRRKNQRNELLEWPSTFRVLVGVPPFCLCSLPQVNS